MRKRIRFPIRAGVGVIVGALWLIAVTGNLASVASATTDDAGTRRGSCRAERAELSAVPERVVAAWADNDAEALADVFTRDATFIVPGPDDGVFLHGRDEIRSYMARLFDGPIRGTTVNVRIDPVRCLSRDVGIVYTVGGMLMPGETEVPTDRIGVQSWVVTQQGGEWLATAYQNARIPTLDPPS